jgi:dihydrodipicolinate synthase/N-acetylneuraminate lyase
MSALDISGVHVPLTTPFDPVTGDVDPVALRANIRSLMEQGISGVVVGGSTGEAVFLDEAERKTLLEAARAVVPGDRLLFAGVGAESTRVTTRMAKTAADVGADAVLVMPPAFYKGAMTPEALREHFGAIADTCPVPVVVYQVPPHLSTVDLSAGLVAELARHENIIGIKESRGSTEAMGELLHAVPRDFQVLVGSGALLYGALEMGAVGGIVAVGHMAPGASVALYRQFKSGNAADAGRLQERIGPLHKEVVGGMGVPGIKVALDLLGQRGGRPRSPLRPLPEKRKEEVAAALRRAGLIQAERSQREAVSAD